MAPYLRSAAHRRWCDLPSEILELVLDLLSLPERISFGGVCSSWRSALLATNLCCLARPPPLMILVYDLNHRPEYGITCILVGLLNGCQAPFMLRSPRPTFSPLDYTVGMSSGWLVIASERDSGLRLLNPISNQQIPLPSTASDGTHITGKNSDATRQLIVTLAVLSSPPTSGDCILVAGGQIFTDHGCKGHYLASCRPGRDQEWTTFTEPRFTADNHVAFHKRELCVLTIYTASGRSILIYNLDRHPILRSCFTVPIPNDMPPHLTAQERLLSSGEELLLVMWHKVYKVGPGVREVVENLGDRVLLLGFNATESFCTQGLMGSGFQPNCIYFASRTRRGAVHRLTKFSIADRRIETIPLLLDDHQIPIGFEWIVTHT